MTELRLASPPRTLPAPEERRPGTLAAVLDWASRRHVKERLDVPAYRALREALPRLSVGLLRAGLGLSVADLAWKDGWRQERVHPLVLKEGPERVRDAAWSYLKEQAEAIRQGLEEEKLQVPAPPAMPEDSTLRALREWLAQGRAQVRQTALPRGRKYVKYATISFIGISPGIHYQEYDEAAAISELQDARHPRAVIPLGDWRRSPARGSCSCEQRHGCRHLLTAFDMALDEMAGPQRYLVQLLAEIDQPPWGKALRIFDQARAAVEVTESRLLSWRLRAAGGEFTVFPVIQKLTRRGALSKGTRASPGALARDPSLRTLPADRRAVALLNLLSETTFNYLGGVQSRLMREVLAHLVGHPRVFLEGDEGGPISVREEPLSFVLEEGKAGGLLVRPGVDGQAVPEAELDEWLQEEAVDRRGIWLDSARRVCWLIRLERAALDFVAALESFDGEFPPESHDALLLRLGALGESAVRALPAHVRGEECPPRPEPLVRVTPRPEEGFEVELLVRPLKGGASFAPGTGPQELSGRDGERRRYTRRDFEAEQARGHLLAASLPLPPPVMDAPFRFVLEQDEDALDLFVELDRRVAEGLEVEWPEERPRLTRPSLRHLRIRVEARGDWFGLDGEVDVDGERVQLALLLAAVRRRRRYVRVGKRRWMALTEELRQRLAPVVDLVFDSRQGLELSPAAAPVFDELAGELGALEAAGSWRSLARRIRQARSLEPRVPAGLNASLRGYQEEGFKWLCRLAAWGAGACLADDMGLGKTIQALALLLERASAGPALVVAPASVGYNWVNEACRFAPSLRPVLYYAELDRAGALARLGPGDVLVTSYELLVRDAAAFAKVRWGTLVLDEAQAIKNHATRRAKAVRSLQVDFRVALTGTPVENHLGELWSLFRVLFPGLLGSWEQFRERFAAPIEREKDAERQAALARALRPFLLRRTKGEVARELPPRTEVELPVALTAEERRLYDEARLSAVAELAASKAEPGQRRFELLAALTRLRLLACHPRLYDEGWTRGSSKLRRFQEVVADLRAEGHRALVFSQFTSHLALVREALELQEVPYLYLDGQTPQEARARLVERFQSGEGEVFLISLKAGGTGLNLTGADYVIHLDPWWNPAVEDQATDRAHRIGQTRPVTVYRMVSQGTIEEAILALHAQKRELSAGVLDGTQAAGALSTEELLALISAGGQGGPLAEEDEAGDARAPGR